MSSVSGARRRFDRSLHGFPDEREQRQVDRSTFQRHNSAFLLGLPGRCRRRAMRAPLFYLLRL